MLPTLVAALLLPSLQAALLLPPGLQPSGCPNYPFCSSALQQARQGFPLVHPGHYNTYSPYLTYSLQGPYLPYTPNQRFNPYSRYSSDGSQLEGLEDSTINGWPSSSLALPPSHPEDCVFLWYFCTDHVAPGWPGNQGKCQQLLSYCYRYVENKNKQTGGEGERPPFLTVVPVTAAPSPDGSSPPAAAAAAESSSETPVESPAAPAPVV